MQLIVDRLLLNRNLMVLSSGSACRNQACKVLFLVPLLLLLQNTVPFTVTGPYFCCLAFAAAINSTLLFLNSCMRAMLGRVNLWLEGPQMYISDYSSPGKLSISVFIRYNFTVFHIGDVHLLKDVEQNLFSLVMCPIILCIFDDHQTI